MRHWVLIKGLKQDQRHWRGVPDAFAHAFGGEVLCLDLPGAGTEAHRRCPPDVREIAGDLRSRWLMSRRETGPWGVLGLSLGGMVALAWAEAHPDDFAGVVVGNTSAADVSPPHRRFRLPNWPVVARSALRRDRVARERAVLDLISAHLDQDGRDALARRHAALDEAIPFRRANLVAQLRAGAGFRAPQQVASPLLVLVGQADRLVDPRCGEGLAQRLGAELRRHPTAGHDLGLDAPDWLVRTVAEWASAPVSPTSSSRHRGGSTG